GNIAVGGADCTVTVYDPRRWSALGRWANCSKYEITGLTFSSLEPSHIYVQGVDYEVCLHFVPSCTQAFCVFLNLVSTFCTIWVVLFPRFYF
ncbi:hypothetical protein MKW98_023164, partial [Papaver atlanticum]